MKLYRAEVLEREKFGDHALLRYRWNGEPPQPGQFVMARTENAAPTFDPFLSRPLFAHDYADGVAELLFEVRGRGTTLLAEEDARLMVSEPLGQGFDTGVGGPVALVGGGVWISPLKLLSRTLKNLDVSHDLYLEIPASAPEAYAAWVPEAYPTATLVPTDGTERPSRALMESLGDLSRYHVLYASGEHGTLVAAKEASCGLVAAQLAVRERMACAAGSCYGCAVPVWNSGGRTYARACVEGPVFAAEVLAW